MINSMPNILSCSTLVTLEAKNDIPITYDIQAIIVAVAIAATVLIILLYCYYNKTKVIVADHLQINRGGLRINIMVFGFFFFCFH
jgi:hypothetical protein